MTERSSTFRNPITNGGEQVTIGMRDISGGTGRYPTYRTPIDGQRTVITVRRPGPCGICVIL